MSFFPPVDSLYPFSAAIPGSSCDGCDFVPAITRIFEAGSPNIKKSDKKISSSSEKSVAIFHAAHPKTPENKNNIPVLTKRYKTPKRRWTEEEDRLLLQAVEKHGPKNWPKIALRVPNRNSKQCRERYKEHLDPKLNRLSWSLEEDLLLLQLHGQFGNQWTLIAEFLLRSPYQIKNRWLSTGSRLEKNHHAKRNNKLNSACSKTEELRILNILKRTFLRV